MKKMISILLAVVMIASVFTVLPISASAAGEEELPSSFDLRDRGVVTPVKKQDPWSTCWAFSSTAAAEISILSMLQDKGEGIDAKTFDLSEKHLAWFGANPITEAVDPDQVGEGMYVTNQEDVPNITYTNGAYGVNVATLYASGIGPVYEKYFPYQGDETITEKQYLIKYPEKGKATAIQAFVDQTGMTPEELIQDPNAEDAQIYLGYLRRNGYLTETDNAKLTAEMVENATLQQYIDGSATTNCYAKQADWSIPEYTTVDGEKCLSRNVSSGFTMVDGNRLPDPFNKDSNGKWESVNWDGVNAIKSELYAGHGVTAGLKADTSAPGEVSEDPLMSEETWAHYTYEDMNTNHMICIVGWDDDYSASNFIEEHQPPANGAWLCKNSWGSEIDYTELEGGGTIGYYKWGIEEDGKHTGYFWISYYDKSLSCFESMTFDNDLSKTDGELAVKMYDYMPSLIGVRTGQITNFQSSEVLKTANIFVNDTGSDAGLYSVSTKTAYPDATVKYSVYQLNDNAASPEDGTLLGTKTAAYEYAGFHREKLDSPITVKKGGKFAVVAEETVVENGAKLYEYSVNVSYSKAHAEAVKAAEAESGISSDDRDRNADEYGVAVVNKGESFVFEDGTWTDWSEYEPRVQNLNDYAIDNFSIKAYMITKTDAGNDDYEYTQTTNSDGFVNTFISGTFCDDKITDADAAYNCVMSVIDRLGGSAATELELDYIRPNENGMTVVSYSQRAGQMLVYGSTVKLIVDKDDNAIGLVSSISPNVEAKPIEEWAVSAAQAEQIVKDQLTASGADGEIAEGASERAIIPSMTQLGSFICVWVVYTYDINKGMDDYAYTAHYVTAEGEYLYPVSVSNPSDPDALSGQSAKEMFDFDAYEQGETQVTLNMPGGSTEAVTVPTLKDTKTGKVYLADAERKILCADVADMFYRDKLTPTEAVDVDPVDAHVYYNFIRVWDYYNSVGWTGPDGKGSPSLLLMNYVDQMGAPIVNACYLTKMKGFQIFAWTRQINFGGCLDIVGHEFTHCVTTNAMKYMIYKNDTGAINEGYSDIMGSLIEIRLDGETDGAWKIAENSGTVYRNLADPHEFAQPAFAFDTYYAPNASVPTEANDKGGVHTNSSLLALCAVRLHEAGMTPREQSYFWLNSAIIISPQTDYPMMAKILPWLMKQLGYDNYLDTLNKAIEEAKFTTTEAPAELPEGCGAATFDFSDYAELAENGRVNILFIKAPEFDVNKRSGTWPVPGSTVAQATLPAGEYVVLVGLASPDGATVKRGILTKDGWKFCEDITPEYFRANGVTITVNEGETTVVPNDTFRPVAVEILSIVDPDYVLPEPEILLGDVDGDGTVTIVDATYIQRWLVSLPNDTFVEAAADTDQDGMITIIDATFIQRWLADLPSNENIGKPIKEDPVLTYCSKSAIDHLGYDNMAMIYNLISDDILPQVVSQLTTAFPTFIDTDGGKAIGERIGLVIYTSEFPDSVASSRESLAYVSGFPLGTENYICMLGVNVLTLFEKDPKTGTYTFKESERTNLENTVIHEMMHAFMNDYVRAGNTTDKTNNYPGWFCEGIASAVENVYTFRYDQYSKIYGYSRGNGESAEVSTDDLLKFYKEYSEVYPVEGGPTHVPDIGTSDDDGNRISAYTMGYLATLYLSYLAQADNPTDYSSFSAGEFRTGLNTIFSLLHSGHTLDEVISSISGGMYKNTDDFTAKFVKGENGDGTNGKGESVTAEVSLGFCVSYLNYLGEVTTQLQNTDSNATANGSILLPLDTAEKSPIKAQAPEGAKENQQYFNIYRDPNIEEEDQPYVYSTVDPAIAYQSGGKTYTIPLN